MIAALWVDDFALQALLRAQIDLPDDTVPWAVVERADYDGATLLHNISAAAQQSGLRRGMTVAQARARVAELLIEARQPALERSAMQALGDVAHSFSPRFELGDTERAGWAYVDVSGLTLLVGRWSEVARALCGALRKVGLAGRVGIARTKTLAQLVARGGDGCQALCGDIAEERVFVAALPLDALTPTPELRVTLRRFGLRSIGDLMMLGEGSQRGVDRVGELAERLGPEGVALYHSARGEDRDLGLQPQPEREVFYEGLELDYGIVELEPLAFVLRGLLDRLVARLRLRGLLVGGIQLTFEYDGRGSCDRTIEIGAPSRDVRSLLDLCRLRLDAEPPERAVRGIGVHVEARSARPRQLSFFEPVGPAPDKLAVTVARLRALCGEARVGTPRPLDSYRDDAFTVEPFTHSEQERQAVVAADSDTPALPALTLRRFRPPQEVTVICYAGEPVRLEGERLAGRIVSWSGPFRRHIGWWQSDRGALSEIYDVQLADGIYYRLHFARREECWWVLGWYD